MGVKKMFRFSVRVKGSSYEYEPYCLTLFFSARDKFPGISSTYFCVPFLIIPSAPTITAMVLPSFSTS